LRFGIILWNRGKYTLLSDVQIYYDSCGTFTLNLSSQKGKGATQSAVNRLL